MRALILFTAALVATPALAATNAPVVAAAAAVTATTPTALAKSGQMVRDANGARLGQVTRVLANGAAVVIFDGRFVTLPADSLTVADGKVATSLTKKQISKL